MRGCFIDRNQQNLLGYSYHAPRPNLVAKKGGKNGPLFGSRKKRIFVKLKVVVIERSLLINAGVLEDSGFAVAYVHSAFPFSRRSNRLTYCFGNQTLTPVQFRRAMS